MKTPLHVLSVGSVEPMCVAYDTFLEHHQCTLIVAKDHHALYKIPGHQSVEAAILHHTVSARELRDASEYIPPSLAAGSYSHHSQGTSVFGGRSLRRARAARAESRVTASENRPTHRQAFAGRL